MSQRFQKIPFDLPDYLAHYLATKLNKQIIDSRGNKRLVVDRKTFFGKLVLESLEVSQVPTPVVDSSLYILVSNHSGDHDSKILRGKRHFLKVNQEKKQKIMDFLKSEFDDDLLTFVEGAEYAHKENGWQPAIKKKGIRKKAIFEFCMKFQIYPNKKNVSTLIKKCQRGLPKNPDFNEKALQNLGEVLSF
ncbi:hypothetical protein L0P88_04040 [Muricauda sp. SCSIO 64092]|uniref:hypothetical protein n=1 Tax=Allomuricauda sp. SCSIO 64092 TaxID=2908842 RepID=UPI001FF69CF8|nr:hypothetical protein [Muricauda sp. SCSIO 64092]UOY07725.1 hypothetical protein L0P88_04040 [Muricauda sp. SCSIO 64092]